MLYTYIVEIRERTNGQLVRTLRIRAPWGKFEARVESIRAKNPGMLVTGGLLGREF